MKAMSPRQAVIYVRVSTGKQAEQGVSLDNQERACGEWANRNNIVVLRTFREEGASAKTLKRPEMASMTEYIQDHWREIDYIIIYQIDRLTRELSDFVEFIRFLHDHKIELRDSTSHLEANDADELIQNIGASLGQYENRLKAKRVKENMRRHAADGYRMHKAPYGLRYIRDEAGRPSVTPIPEIADKIAYLLLEFAKGVFTKAQLLHEARRIGLKQPNGKLMSYQCLDKILRQPLYAGLEKGVLTDNQLIPSTFAGIVPEWVYHTNQQLLESRRLTKSDGYKTNSPDYPLRRFVTCEGCGQPLRGSASTGRGGKKYPRYHCTTPTCHSAYIKPDELHEQFLDLLREATPSEDTLRVIKTIIIRVWRDEVKTMRIRRSRLRNAIDKLQEQKLDAAESFVAKEITAEEKVSVINRLMQRLGIAKAEAEKIDRLIGTKEEAVDYALNCMGNAPKLWADASPDMKPQFQRMLFPEGVSFNLRTKKFGTTKMSALYSLVPLKSITHASSKAQLVTPTGIEPVLPG